METLLTAGFLFAHFVAVMVPILGAVALFDWLVGDPDF